VPRSFWRIAAYGICIAAPHQGGELFRFAATDALRHRARNTRHAPAGPNSLIRLEKGDAARQPSDKAFSTGLARSFDAPDPISHVTLTSA
jgi:hypothetical protein